MINTIYNLEIKVKKMIINIRNDIMLNDEQISVIIHAMRILNEHEKIPISDINAIMPSYRTNAFYLYTYMDEDNLKSDLKFIGAILYDIMSHDVIVIRGDHIEKDRDNVYTVFENIPSSLANKVFRE